MLQKLQEIEIRFVNVRDSLSDPSVLSDMKRYKALNKEYKDLEKIVEVSKKYQNILENIQNAKEILDTEDDPEMKEMARDELNSLEPDRDQLEEEIKFMLIPKDPEDSRDVMVEIRAGAGGDEAAIFAGDLYRMYTRFFESQKWKVDVVSTNEGTSGGFSKVVLEVMGEDVYGRLKFESGAHRVQRVPKTESQGRVHTSAATVVVMPKLEMEDVDINKADLKVDTFRSSGAGGQHVNKTESGVRFTHIPTGVVSESTDGRSQIKNREIALQRLYQKIYDAQKSAHDSKLAAARKSLVGSGDRSDKVRTYNYPQNRVTDHRINLTLYSLDKIIDGDVAEIMDALALAENTEKLKEGATI